MRPSARSGDEPCSPVGFSRRLRRRHRLWWGRPARLSEWRRAADVLHRFRERTRFRSRDDPEQAWRCCAHWQRTLINKWNGREFAARHGVPLPELYWWGRSLWAIPVRSLPSRFVVRPVFGRKRRGAYVVVDEKELLREEPLDAERLRRRLVREHGPWLLEPILVEAFARPEDGRDRLPTEVKLHVFRDVVAAIEMVERDNARPEAARVRFFDVDWEPCGDPMLTATRWPPRRSVSSTSSPRPRATGASATRLSATSSSRPSGARSSRMRPDGVSRGTARRTPYSRPVSGGRMLRWAGLALPAVVAVGLGWSYAGSFLHPTFLGDQGVRLDRASELVVGVGERQWLPFLQLHVHALYRLGAPVQTFLLVPYAYAVASLFLLAWLCRSVLREPREFVPATVLLLLGFAGSTFHWLGRSLYQEAIVIPLFLALVGLHRFAPRQRAAFVGVLGIGMLTREVFWIWWLSYGVLHWRGRLREPGLRRAVLALGAIPLGWLLLTGQGPLLARNAPEPLGVTPIAERAALLARGIAAEWLLPALVLSALTFAIAAAQRGWRGLAFRGFHVFSAVSLALVYGYVLLADPWHTTPGNTRALVPLFAHLLVWTLLGWHEATRLSGAARPAGRVLAALAMLSLLKVPAIAGVLGGPPPKRSVDDWERLRLPAASRAEAGWERTLEATLEPLRARRGGPLRVALVDVSRREYLKLWVAAFLYDERRVVPAGAPLPPADVILAPEGFRAPGLVRRARLRVSSDATRDVLVPTRD